MKNLPGTLICGLVIFNSCHEKVEVVEETFENGANMVVITYEINGDEKSKISYEKYYQNGQLNIVGDYRNEKRHGQWNSYHDNGNKWSSVVYVDGLREGESKIYFPSGELNIQGQFKDDVASGIWTWYNKEGEIVKEINYSELKNR